MYGHNILTGSTIDRKKLAHIVFNDNKELKNLEAITHKHIIINVVEELQSLKDYKYIALDAPLLIETKLNRYVDETWLITSKLYKRISRIIKRDKLDYDEVIKRFESQTPFNELMKFADLIIYNNDKLSTLKKLILYRLEVSYAKNK
jgi:dephospho-CoA kinase